ncbi:hypothetical protein Tco_1517740 [Tanacetum coccineum]
MERGFLGSGVKKKDGGSSKEGVSKDVAGAAPILGDIAKRVKSIDGVINVPKSILRKPARGCVLRKCKSTIWDLILIRYKKFAANVKAIPEEVGKRVGGMVILRRIVRVEYEWKPPHCFDCKSFGHEFNLCPKRVREEVPNNSARDTKATVMVENDDGFTEVKSRKKKKGADSRHLCPLG